MRCAVVDLATSEVVNVIVAQQDDPAPEGCILVDIPDDSPVSIGWLYVDGVFIAPSDTVA